VTGTIALSQHSSYKKKKQINVYLVITIRCTGYALTVPFGKFSVGSFGDGDTINFTYTIRWIDGAGNENEKMYQQVGGEEDVLVSWTQTRQFEWDDWRHGEEHSINLTTDMFKKRCVFDD